MNRIASYTLIYFTLVLGMGPMLLFALFLFIGSFSLINLGLEMNKALLFDACLSLLFFCQHSIMIRRSFRGLLSGIISDDYYPAFYALASGAVLLMVMVFWQKVPNVIYTADGISYWILRVFFFGCIAGFQWGARSLGSFDALGIKRIQRLLRNRETRELPLTAKGAYRWVRHPLYFFSLLMIWSCPVLTADRLIFNILWSLWIVVATMLEEQDLIHDFGDQYRTYQTQVPMIIPYRIPRQGMAGMSS